MEHFTTVVVEGTIGIWNPDWCTRPGQKFRSDGGPPFHTWNE